MILRRGYPRPDVVPDGYRYVSTNRERMRHRRPVPWGPIVVAAVGVLLIGVAAFCLWKIHAIEARQAGGRTPATWVTPSTYGPPPACTGFPARRCAP